MWMGEQNTLYIYRKDLEGQPTILKATRSTSDQKTALTQRVQTVMLKLGFQATVLGHHMVFKPLGAFFRMFSGCWGFFRSRGPCG